MLQHGNASSFWIYIGPVLASFGFTWYCDDLIYLNGDETEMHPHGDMLSFMRRGFVDYERSAGRLKSGAEPILVPVAN